MMRVLLLGCALWLCGISNAWALPPDPSEYGGPAATRPSPYTDMVRHHFYQQLRKRPERALLWELALPGAGHYYVGFRMQAVVLAAVSVAGASLWIAGAVKDDAPLYWSGVGVFSAARLSGLVGAPVGAALLNRAFRRQLGIARRR